MAIIMSVTIIIKNTGQFILSSLNFSEDYYAWCKLTTVFHTYYQEYMNNSCTPDTMQYGIAHLQRKPSPICLKINGKRGSGRGQ